MSKTILTAALGCMLLLTACGTEQNVKTDVKVKTNVTADADTGITFVPDSDTIRKNLEKNGYTFAPFGDTTTSGNEIISASRGVEAPNFSCIMIIRAASSEALFRDEDAIQKAEQIIAQYDDAVTYRYENDEKLGTLYIFCTADALADAGITAGS